LAPTIRTKEEKEEEEEEEEAEEEEGGEEGEGEGCRWLWCQWGRMELWSIVRRGGWVGGREGGRERKRGGGVSVCVFFSLISPGIICLHLSSLPP